MHRKFRTTFIILTLAISCIVIALSLSALFAASGVGPLKGSTLISYNVYPEISEQLTSLNEVGLAGTPNPDGTITLNSTSVSDGLSSSKIKETHDSLIANGMLRYVIYDGSICHEARGLIVILDFSNYNVSEFQSGFLGSLSYSILGSHSLWGLAGYTFEEHNGEGGALTVFDSSQGGTVRTDRITLTLQGIYESGQLANSYVTKADGTKVELTQYCLRIVLPRILKAPVHMQSGSLAMRGVSIGRYQLVAPTCIALGISHLDIQLERTESGVAWNNTINIAGDATDRNLQPHFHWMTVTGNQMAYALTMSLNEALTDPNYSEGDIDEIFKKPSVESDFSYLFFRMRKVTDKKLAIGVYDAPEGTNTETTEKGIAAAISMIHWLTHVYNLPSRNVNNLEIEYRHYLRSADNKVDDNNNEIDENYGILTVNAEQTFEHEGKTCYQVRCTHSAEADCVIGYYSVSGDLYDAHWKAISAA